MAKRPVYFNYIEKKVFNNRAEAEQWANSKKKTYKDAGQSVRKTVSYENDQKWHAKILPKV